MTKRAQARQIFQAAVLTHLSTVAPLLWGRKRIWLLGAGKASAPLARAVEKVRGKRIAGGFMVKDGQEARGGCAERRECGLLVAAVLEAL